MKIRLISWDVDGTLYAVEKLRRRLIFTAMWRSLLFRGSAMRAALQALSEFYQSCEAQRPSGGGVGGVLAGVDRRKLLEHEARYIIPALARQGPRKGVIEALQCRPDIPQIAVSDYACEHKLEALGLAGHFQDAYSGESQGYIKPDPSALVEAAGKFNLPLEQILHIGDRPETDGAMASVAGCRCLILGQDFADMRSLPQLLTER